MVFLPSDSDKPKIFTLKCIQNKKIERVLGDKERKRKTLHKHYIFGRSQMKGIRCSTTNNHFRFRRIPVAQNMGKFNTIPATFIIANDGSITYLE